MKETLSLKIFILALIVGTTSSLAVDSWTDDRPVDLSGNIVDPLADAKARAVVLIFLATDCPISNRYAPLVNRIYDKYSELGIRFYAVYPIPGETVKAIRQHRADYRYQLPALMDPAHYLVKKAEALVTPEASVYVPASNQDGAWVYRGRIDDLYVDFGKWRHAPTENNLIDTLDKILAGEKLSPKRTRAIGCYIPE